MSCVLPLNVRSDPDLVANVNFTSVPFVVEVYLYKENISSVAEWMLNEIKYTNHWGCRYEGWSTGLSIDVVIGDHVNTSL